MTTEYLINVLDHGGQLITQIQDEIQAFHFYQFVGQPGGFTLDLPETFPLEDLPIDGIIELNRTTTGGTAMQTFMAGIIRDQAYFPFSGDVERLRVFGAGPNEFLERRIVAFALDSAQALKTAEADDMMKEVVSENLKPGGVRDMGSFFTVASDDAAGPSITKGFAWRNVLNVCQDISLASEEAGTQVFFDVQRTAAYQFQFRTFTGQVGSNRAADSGQDTHIFSKEFGNIAHVSLERIYRDEENYIYAGGQGTGTDREIVEVSDDSRIGRSPFNRREAFQQSVQHKETAGITGEANERLARGRPREVFEADVLDAPGSIYGVDWLYGDRITAMYKNRSYNGMIYGVDLSLTEDGAESLTGFLRSENVI